MSFFADFEYMVVRGKGVGARVARISAAASISVVLGLVFYRHWTLGLDSTESLLVTSMLVLVLLLAYVMIGSCLAAALYVDFLRAVGAKREATGWVGVYVELLIAVVSPPIGFALLFAVATWAGG